MAKRVCSEPGCPNLTTPGARGGRCKDCAREADRARGTRQERGYDAQHDRLRAAWQRILNRPAPVQCTSPSCLTPGEPVNPHDWHLGHDDQRQHRGPEHPACNLSAAGRASHAQG